MSHPGRLSRRATLIAPLAALGLACGSSTTHDGGPGSLASLDAGQAGSSRTAATGAPDGAAMGGSSGGRGSEQASDTSKVSVSGGSSTASSSHVGSSGSAGWTDGGADASTSLTDAAVATQIRVHYPVGSHTVTLRGGTSPLSWTTGATLTADGADTWTYTVPAMTGPIECKPLLDDTTWAIGPNYHVAPGQTLDIYPHFKATTGQVSRLLPSFHSTVLNNDRVIWAYLPPSYAENTAATYPVVYMHDGQNLWAAFPDAAFSATWNVDTAFDTASNVGACSSATVTGWGAQPLGGTAKTCNGDADCGTAGVCRSFPEAIVIGVSNEGGMRTYEYTPTADPSEADAGLGPQGGADQYLAMLVTELKPTIDGMLRTRPDVASTVMAGSSLGGLVTAYAGVKRADVFGKIAALSPSSWWDSDVIVADVMGSGSVRPTIVYVDSGQGTADDEMDTDKLASAYLGLGYVTGASFRHVIQPDAQHGETWWAERFPGAMQLVLGPR